jgi:hypothetical protein
MAMLILALAQLTKQAIYTILVNKTMISNSHQQS